MDEDKKITLLDVSQKVNIIWSELKDHGEAEISDFAMLLGGQSFTFNNEKIGRYWLNQNNKEDILHAIVNPITGLQNADTIIECRSFPDNINIRYNSIRPVLESKKIYESVKKTRNGDYLEAEYGEYPQSAVSKILNNTLENKYKDERLKMTEKEYTVDSISPLNTEKVPFSPEKLPEFQFGDEKYVRVVARLYFDPTTLSNGEIVHNGDPVWVRVSPITWIVSSKCQVLLAKDCLVSGIKYYEDYGKFKNRWHGDFEETLVYQYLQDYLQKDIVSSKTASMTHDEKKEYDTLQSIMSEKKKMELNEKKLLLAKKKMEEAIELYNQIPLDIQIESKGKITPEILFQVMDDGHKIINPKIKNNLKYFDLSNIDFTNTDLSGIDFTGCNIKHIDPQTIYNKDLSNTTFRGVYLPFDITTDFNDVNTENIDIDILGDEITEAYLKDKILNSKEKETETKESKIL